MLKKNLITNFLVNNNILRLSIFKSSQHIFIRIINDFTHRILYSLSTNTKDFINLKPLKIKFFYLLGLKTKLEFKNFNLIKNSFYSSKNKNTGNIKIFFEGYKKRLKVENLIL